MQNPSGIAYKGRQYETFHASTWARAIQERDEYRRHGYKVAILKSPQAFEKSVREMERRGYQRNPGKSSRFERCVADVSRRGGVDSPEAVCASSLRRAGWEPRRNEDDLLDRLQPWIKSAKKSAAKNSRTVVIAMGYLGPKMFFKGQKSLAYGQDYVEVTPSGGVSRHRQNPANSASAAASAAESFHGPDPEGVSETVIVEDLHEHSALVGLGELTQIKLKGGVKISKFQRAILCSNEAGTQLFVRGGDQQVSLSDFDVDATKEKVNLGRITHLDYKTRKFHLDEEDKALGIYRHRLGEVTGVLPDLVYDTINAKLEFVGGAYYIKWDDYDGAHSAGIAN